MPNTPAPTPTDTTSPRPGDLVHRGVRWEYRYWTEGAARARRDGYKWADVLRALCRAYARGEIDVYEGGNVKL